ncbi:MAG: hypothetical protein ACM3WV_06785 [Bacillota bacterium]
MFQFRKGVSTAVVTFFLSLLLSFSLLWKDKINITAIAAILVIVIITGIVFDIVGTAAAAATESGLHAMAADKVSGAQDAILLIRRADRVANFCNDVIGDICGTVSGALASALALRFYRMAPLPPDLWIVACAAALTVGGKALGKQYAIEEANNIIFGVGKGMYWLRRNFPGMKQNKTQKNSKKRK